MPLLKKRKSIVSITYFLLKGELAKKKLKQKRIGQASGTIKKGLRAKGRNSTAVESRDSMQTYGSECSCSYHRHVNTVATPRKSFTGRSNLRSEHSKVYLPEYNFSQNSLYSDSNLQNHHNQSSTGYIQMSDFFKLLNMILPHIEEGDSLFKRWIPPQEKLRITLEFLVQGDSYFELSQQSQISRRDITRIIPDICSALVDALRNEIKVPKSTNEWIRISQNFLTLWNFPHCLGTLDGKRIVTQAQLKNGSEFSNTYMVLMTIIDAHYKFIYVDVECKEIKPHEDVFAHTKFYNQQCEESFYFPRPAPLQTTRLPYIFISNSEFPLAENILKPFEGHWDIGSKERAFNFRVRRVRAVADNTFGFMSSVFRVLKKPLRLQRDNAMIVTLACIYLHNFLLNNGNSQYNHRFHKGIDKECNGHLVKGVWRKDANDQNALRPLRNVDKSLPRHRSLVAEKNRNDFAEYCKTARLTWRNYYDYRRNE